MSTAVITTRTYPTMRKGSFTVTFVKKQEYSFDTCDFKKKT